MRCSPGYAAKRGADHSADALQEDIRTMRAVQAARAVSPASIEYAESDKMHKMQVGPGREITGNTFCSPCAKGKKSKCAWWHLARRPVDTFQPQEGQSSCLKCEDGKSRKTLKDTPQCVTDLTVQPLAHHRTHTRHCGGGRLYDFVFVELDGYDALRL